MKIAESVVLTQLLLSTIPTITSAFAPIPNPSYHRLSKQLIFSSQHRKSSTLTCLSLSTPSSRESNDVGRMFDEKQLDFTIGYLNKHHPDAFVDFAEAFTPLGVTQANKNSFSGASFTIDDAKLVGLNYYVGENVHDEENYITLEVNVSVRGEKEPRLETVQISLDAEPNVRLKRKYKNSPILLKPDKPEIANPIDDFVRRMNRLCLICHQPVITGKLIQLGIQIGGEKVGYLKESMYLNQVPHNRYVRKYFYDMVADSVMDAVVLCSEGKISNRMKMELMIPEMNPEMDAYRIGTLLEATRAIAIKMAEQNIRIRVCVQGSMGEGIFTGTPKQLSGVSTLLQRMDWQSGENEENEGMIGDFVNFGAIGKNHVTNARTDRKGNKIEQDDVFLLLCPQSMIGVDSSIFQPLEEMVEAVGDRPIILLNSDLTDKPSSQGQQSVRGRQDRINFAETFKTIYHFTCTYPIGASYFPIVGAVGKFGPTQPWVAYQRKDRVNDGGEVYIPVLSTEEEPSSAMMMETFD